MSPGTPRKERLTTSHKRGIDSGARIEESEAVELVTVRSSRWVVVFVAMNCIHWERAIRSIRQSDRGVWQSIARRICDCATSDGQSGRAKAHRFFDKTTIISE